MDNYLLLVDTYEAKTVNESVLKANNVAGMIIRMNHIWPELHIDNTFVQQWKETGEAGLLRAPYYVYDPKVDGQANYDWLVKHLPFEAGSVMVDIEVERPGYSPDKYAEEVAKFCALVKPRWNPVIYTGAGYLNLLSQWPKDLAYWWAQYPYALYPSTPERLTWDQLRAKLATMSGPSNAEKIPGTWKMWQASDKLILPGCDEPMDVNVFPGTFAELKAWINEKPIIKPDPFPDEHTQPFAGVDFYKIYRYKSHCFVAVINPVGKTFLVTKFGRKKVSTVARELGAQVVINGGAYSGRAIGLHASQGKVYVNVVDYEPWLNLTETSQVQINPYNSKATKYNALAGKRFIVQDGRISPNTSAAWMEYHPRTLAGVTLDGKLIECVIDGRQGPDNFGVTLYDAARVMLEFGAWRAIDLDGGGSSAMWVKDRIVNSPIENGIPGNERLVGTHVAMFVGGGTPLPDDYVVVQPVKPRLNPSMYETISKSNLPAGTTFHSTTTKVVKEKIPAGPTGMEYVITWVQMPDGYWVPKFYKSEYVKNQIG
jgi:GH25 family lysozyme M1 (1,4-beta-N-acetylmuramidase)